MGNVTKKVKENGGDANVQIAVAEPHNGPGVLPHLGIGSTIIVQALTEEQKKIITESWKFLEKDIAEVGIIVFINLFETYPDFQSAFSPFTGMVLDDLKKSKLLRQHALRVMGAVQRAVFRLNEPDKLDAFLCDLGRQHNRNGAKIEYIDYIGPQFIAAIRPSLTSQWTPELENAWTQLLTYISQKMKESMLQSRQRAEDATGSTADSGNIGEQHH